MGSWGLCLTLGGGANRREAAQLGLSCKPALLCGIMEEPGADPDLVDEDVLDIELLDDNLEEEEEVEEVFESPRKRPSILLSLTGCSRVALSPFADLEVPQTRLDPPTPSSPLPRSPSQFLRYSELQVFLVNLRDRRLAFSLFCTGVSPTPAGCREPARRRCTTTRRRKEATKMTPSVQKGRSRRLIWRHSSGR